MATTTLPDEATATGAISLLDDDRRRIWHKSAPEAIARAYQDGKPQRGWNAWTAHLAARRNPAAAAEVFGEGVPALLWGVAGELGDEPGDPVRLVKRLAASKKSSRGFLEAADQLQPWLLEAESASLDVRYAVECLAWCHALPQLAPRVDEARWWETLDHLLRTAAAARQIDLAAAPLIHQLLAGELPLALAYLLPELRPCRRLESGGREAISRGLEELLDRDGTPHRRHLERLRPLLAVWTRCALLAPGLKHGALTGRDRNQYEWAVRVAVRWTRRDGSQMLTSAPAGVWCPELFDAALAAGGDDDDREFAVLALPGASRKTKDDPSWTTPEAAGNSQWAGVAMLRPEWSPRGERLAVVYGEPAVRSELCAGDDVLWSGCWDLDVRWDDQPLRPTCDWEEVCWVSDDDADYLELEIELTGGVTVQRQILLAREHRFLFTADAVLGQNEGRIEYAATLPLGEGVSFEPAEETREGRLTGRKRRALVMPLALPEWRTDRRFGQLAADGAGLTLRQSATAARLYAPLFLDLDPRRRNKAFTWRQLTVAASRRIQPRDVAVGYRVQVGGEQWLFYRSLAAAESRTVLGQNLNNQFLAATFLTTGETEPLIEIE